MHVHVCWRCHIWLTWRFISGADAWCLKCNLHCRRHLRFVESVGGAADDWRPLTISTMKFSTGIPAIAGYEMVHSVAACFDMSLMYVYALLFSHWTAGALRFKGCVGSQLVWFTYMAGARSL